MISAACFLTIVVRCYTRVTEIQRFAEMQRIGVQTDSLAVGPFYRGHTLRQANASSISEREYAA